MTHMQYIPGDPRVVDQLVYELKSRGIFDQFRKECIADVDTRPAYQNLRQRVETSVATFLARQVWKPDLNKNQLREKLRKHILDGNYLEQGVERIVDQVVNPKVASVFIPQVEDLVYDFFGIPRKKSTAPATETSSNGKVEENNLLPTDLEAVSPGSVKSNDNITDVMDVDDLKEENKMEIENKMEVEIKEDTSTALETNYKEKNEIPDTQMSGASGFTPNDSDASIDKILIPLPSEDIKPEDIPPPDNSPPKVAKVELESIELPKEPNVSTDIPLPDEIPTPDKDHYFKPITVNSDDDSSSDSSLRRNMSPLTPIRNFNNENSCDAQQAFENQSTEKNTEMKEPSSFRFAIETKSPENSSDAVIVEKKVDPEPAALAYQFSNQVNINTFNTPLYDDSSNSNLLHIDYESDANSKTNTENKVPDAENSEDSKKEKKIEEKKSSNKSSHHSRDSHRYSSNKDRRSGSKHSSSRDSSRHERKSTSSKDDHSKSKSSYKEGAKDKSDKKDRESCEKKDSRDSSKHRSSHKSSSSHKDSKSHKSSSSSSSQRHSSSKQRSSEEKRSSSSSHKDKSDKNTEKSSKEKERSSRDSKSSSHRSDKDRKSSSSKTKHEDKEKQKKDKKETDDHYSLSGRGNNTRRSTDRDSNDGSSSSKGSNNPSSSKSSESKKDSKSTAKSDNISTSSESTSPSDKEHITKEVKHEAQSMMQSKPIVRVETHLEMPIAVPPRLPFVPDVTLKKPKFAANLQEARKLMKMRKFLDEEQKRMNQEAALLLEFQANVRPSLSQVYSNISGPELEFACITNAVQMVVGESQYVNDNVSEQIANLNSTGENATHNQNIDPRNDALIEILTAAQQVDDIEEQNQQVNDSVETIQNKFECSNIQNESESPNIRSESESTNIQNEEDVSVDTKATVQQIDNTEIIIDPDNNILIVEPEKGEVTNQINDIQTENVSKTLSCEPESIKTDVGEIIEITDEDETKNNVETNLINLLEENSKKHTEYFEVTIITEELSESEDTDKDSNIVLKDLLDEVKQEISEQWPDENMLEYFGEHEKYNAEIECDKFNTFIKSFMDKVSTNKMYLINCDTYEENILKEMSQNFGDFEIVNYYKNGHFKPSKGKNVKDVNVSAEIMLPVDSTNNDFEVFELNTPRSPIFSPVKSECSFELSSDYDAKLEEMVNKTSRQEIMEIILGNVVDDSPSKMPTIDYCNESSIESNSDNTLKRKLSEVESSVNNNRNVLTSNKIRKLSGSDQITSTTEENEESSNNNVVTTTRSKYLGRARRVGLPRPRRTITDLPNSPSSDKSVENYEQNTPVQTPNGKMKSTPRSKVQRYDTSDLYKPKLHYLSRRNNIS